MTHNHIVISAFAAIWLIGIPGFLALMCWTNEKHIITRGNFIVAPFFGWAIFLTVVTLMICFGPLVLIGAGFKRLFPAKIPKPPSAFAKWLEAPAFSCRRRMP